MSLQTLIPIVLEASMLLSVLAIGLRASAQDATYLFRRPAELGRALLAMNVLMPLFAVALVSIFDLRPAVAIALVALAVSPIPPLLPNKLTKAGGTKSYAIGLLVAAGVLAIVFVPAALEILELIFNIPLKMNLGSVAALICTTVLLPLALGIAVHDRLPSLAKRLVRPIAQIAGIALLASVIAILFSAAPSIWSLIGNGIVIALAAFVLVGLTIGHVLGGPEPENRSALAISTASRHPGIAIAIAVANFPQQKLATAAVLLYLLVNAVFSLPYHFWLKHREHQKASTPA
jgi:bile acid:Na+ symporter, BASS family